MADEKLYYGVNLNDFLRWYYQQVDMMVIPTQYADKGDKGQIEWQNYQTNLKLSVEEIIKGVINGEYSPDSLFSVDLFPRFVEMWRDLTEGERKQQQTALEDEIRKGGKVIIASKGAGKPGILEYNGSFYDPDTLQLYDPPEASRIYNERMAEGMPEMPSGLDIARTEQIGQTLKIQAEQWEWQKKQANIEAAAASEERLYQQGLAQQQLGMQRGQLQLQAQQQAWERQQASPEAQEAIAKAQQSRQWEYEREQTLQNLEQTDKARNWIKKWYWQQGANPYQGYKYSDEGLRQFASGRMRELKQELEIPLELAFIQGETGLGKYKAAYDELISLSNQYPDIAASQMGGAPAGGVGGRGAAAQPAKAFAPPVPDWLRQFAPGVGKQPWMENYNPADFILAPGGTAAVNERMRREWGQLTKVPVTTPSPTQWAKTPWSQQEGLRGYMDWTGQSYEDMLQNMYSMIPQPTPRKTWAPARQRR